MNVSTLNQTCEEARLLGVQILRDEVETTLRYFSIAVFALLFPFSVCLTSFTIFLILKFKHLRQTTFLLAMQLLILDLVVVLTFTPVSLIGAANGRWILGLPFCKIVHSEVIFVYQVRGWLMFVFVCDRFCTVFVPFGYPKYRRKIIWSLYALVLIVTVVALIVLLTFDCSAFDRQLWLCISLSSEICPNSGYCELYTLIESIFINAFGGFIPLVMYTALFIKAKRVRNRITFRSTPEDGEQRKRDRKANVTFFIIFISLFGVTFPPLCVFVIIHNILLPLGVEPPEFLLILGHLLHELYWILSIADSIAILRNPEVRNAVRELINKLRMRTRGQLEITITTSHGKSK